MKAIKHIKLEREDYGYFNADKCPCKNDFAHFLWEAAPEIKWYYVEDVGSYQGVVYAIGKYEDKIFIMKDYYGSCSGCGAWGEGGEPEDLKSVLENGELFDNKEDAYKFADKTYNHGYEQPTKEFFKAIREL